MGGLSSKDSVQNQLIIDGFRSADIDINNLAGVLDGVGLRPLTLQSGPVTDGQQLGPDLVLVLGVSVELMRVRCILDF